MSVSFDNISSILNNATTNAANQSANKLENSLDADMSQATDEELMDVCKEFEAYFIEQMYKEMQKTIPKSDDSDSAMSQLTDFFKDEAIQDLASQSVEQGGNGLAQQLYEQMKRNYDI